MLYFAACHGDLTLLMQLLETAAPLNWRGAGEQTALHCAAYEGHTVNG